MRVLVTGGAGFIGSHMVGELIARRHIVTVLDDFSTGKRSNLQNLPEISVIEGNILNPAMVSHAVQGMDAVIHLAAIASVQASVDDSMGTHQVNLVGTLNLLEAAAAAGVNQFLYACSAAVYGDQGLLPGELLTEAHPTIPQTPYAVDKLAGEYYLRYYHTNRGLRGTSFRLFNVYGSRQDSASPYSGVIS